MKWREPRLAKILAQAELERDTLLARSRDNERAPSMSAVGQTRQFSRAGAPALHERSRV